LRILVAGRRGAGKSLLVDTLAAPAGQRAGTPRGKGFRIQEVVREGLPPLLLVDSPGFDVSEPDPRMLVERASESDMILWVAAAHHTDRALDRDALDALRRSFAKRPDRGEPPLLVVLTHIDMPLPRRQNGGKPGLGDGLSQTVDMLARDLAVRRDEIVPLTLRYDEAAPAIEPLVSAMAQRMQSAQRAQLLRLMADAAPRLTVGKLLRQGAKATWTAARSILPGRAYR
jgi:predicted GTPase